MNNHTIESRRHWNYILIYVRFGRIPEQQQQQEEKKNAWNLFRILIR